MWFGRVGEVEVPHVVVAAPGTATPRIPGTMRRVRRAQLAICHTARRESRLAIPAFHGRNLKMITAPGMARALVVTGRYHHSCRLKARFG